MTTPLIKKLKGLTPKDEDLATLTARMKMARAIQDLDADCTGTWSGSADLYMERLVEFFPKRFRATQLAQNILVKNFGEITWHTASLQLIYTGSKTLRSNINFSHVINGVIKATNLPIQLIYRQSMSPISGQRVFKVGNYRQCSITAIDGANSWKRENNYIG